MANAQPMLRIDRGWIPVTVTDEIPPPEKREQLDAGFLVVKCEPAPAEDAPAHWAKWGGKRLKVPAYMVYQYEAKLAGVKPNKVGGKPLGQMDALKGGAKTDLAGSIKQSDQVVDLDAPGAAQPSGAVEVTVDDTGVTERPLDAPEPPASSPEPSQVDEVTAE